MGIGNLPRLAADALTITRGRINGIYDAIAWAFRTAQSARHTRRQVQAIWDSRQHPGGTYIIAAIWFRLEVRRLQVAM